MNTQAHGMYQFNFDTLTKQEVANLTIITVLSNYNNDIYYQVVNCAIKCCKQFENFTIDDFFIGKTPKIHMINLVVDITYEFLLSFLEHFKLSTNIKENEWFKLDEKQKELSEIKDDTQPLSYLDENDIVVNEDSHSAFNNFINELEF